MRRSSAILAAAAVALAGCTATQWQRANAAYEDAFVPIESIGRFDGWRQKATPARLLDDGHPLSLVEIGRRWEKGVGGLPQDRTCAAYWYQRAFETPYDEAQTTYAGGMVVQAGTVRRAGLPQARVAMKHLLKAGPLDADDVASAQSRCSYLPG